jgi:sugar (pentulose or hexulose) kinase
MSYLAIDIGSSFIKSAVLDTEAFSITQFQSQPTPARLPDPNPRIYEVALEKLLEVIGGLIQCSVSANPELRGILLTTQAHGFVLTDASGEAVTPYISWQDTRCLDPIEATGGSVLDQLRQRTGASYRGTSGIFLKPGLALPNLFALLGATPQLRDAPGGLRFHTLGSYVIAKLTGSYACHITNAAATGMVDISQRTWNRPLLQVLGLDTLDFPEILPESESCGFHEIDGRRLAVYPDIGDHHATMLGSLISPVCDVCCNIATAAQMTTISHKATSGQYEVRPFFDGHYLNTVTGLPGGRCLDVLVDWLIHVGETIFSVHKDRSGVWARILELDTASAGGSLRVKTGFFEGTVGVEEGAIENIRDHNLTTVQLFSAAYANIAETYAALLELLHPQTQTPERFVFCGGVARKNLPLRDSICAIAGLPGSLSTYAHEVFVGLFRITLVIDQQSPNITATREMLTEQGPKQLEIEEEPTP